MLLSSRRSSAPMTMSTEIFFLFFRPQASKMQRQFHFGKPIAPTYLEVSPGVLEGVNNHSAKQNGP